ncbi:MAG: sulfatase-like hydrolase/transferase [Alphaproteobacteria bacterium]|nr:sulfatase-like hydrolase/transferase [Alphaproteobacteria bacterium]
MKLRIALAVIAVLAGLGAFAWFHRVDITLFLASRSGKFDVAPTQPIAWDAGPETPAAAPAERPPNIIFILADDLGFNDISTFGGGVAGGRVPTPNIDRLAAQGAVFTQAYSGTATCAPSRAMLMTGRYPTRTGFEFTPTPPGMGRIISMISSASSSGLPPVIYDADAASRTPPFRDQGLPGSEVTIAETLRAAGYHTVHIGKWHLGNGAEFGPNAQGFDESLLMASGLHLPDGDPRGVSAKLDFDPIDRFLWARMQFAASFNDGPWFAPGGYLADYWTDESLRVIEANRNRPFFLYLAHWSVHSPLQATREDYDAVGDIEPHRLRVYAAMVRALDRSVGRILDALDRQGMSENTIVVFSSDNGGAGYIGLEDINAPYRGWKATMFEGGIRVPLFMRWPGRIPAGARITAPVAHIDVAPTLTAAANASAPEGVEIDGRNLLPLAFGETQEAPHDAIFWQSGHYRAVRQGDWKLQVSQRPARALLFNLAEDPEERNNLADAMPDRVAALRALLDAHQQGARPPLYPYSVEAPIAIDHSLAQPANEGDEIIYWPN